MDSKILKLHKEPEGTRFGEDRISNLPDSLLHHILSFLPTKKAFVTSILSTRWRYLFNSIPSLDFDEDHRVITNLDAKRCMNFVERRLLLRGMSHIQKFNLSYTRHFDESRVNGWIRTVIDRKVEELDLRSLQERQKPVVFPSCLFTCESLAVLKLDLESVLTLPPSIFLPRLKVLHLSNIEFSDDYPISHFFSNCPVLNELVLSGCWGGMKKFLISAPALQRLRFGRDDFWSEGLGDCEVVVDAPKLEYLVYSALAVKDFILPSLQSLCDATIEIGDDPSLVDVANFAIKLLRGFCSMKYLELSGQTIEVLARTGDTILNLPRFCNLIRLEVSMQFPCGTLLDLFEIMPNLHSLIFKDMFTVSSFEELTDGLTIDNENGEVMLSKVPQCLLSNLKTLEFRMFKGNIFELFLLRLFLKNAKVMERITIFPAGFGLSSHPKQAMEIAKQLLMLPRASPSCVIKFC